MDINWQELYENYRYVVRVLLILVGAVLLNYILRSIVSRYFRRESARINVDPTAYNFMKNATTFIVVVVTFFVIVYNIPALEQIAISLFAGAGILAAIIGFASQTAFSNIINGVMIVAFKPFRIGDVIEMGTREDYTGTVEDITLRHTVIRNFENKRVIIPNSVISTEVIVNRSIVDPKTLRFIELDLALSANIDKAIELIRDEAEKHPLLIDNRTELQIMEGLHKIPIRVMNVGPAGVRLRVSIWAVDSTTSFLLKTDLLKSIKERFEAEGVEIMYPYTNVIVKDFPGQKTGNDGEQ